MAWDIDKGNITVGQAFCVTTIANARPIVYNTYYMNFTVSYSPKTEAVRLLTTLDLVVRGFYLKEGFYVLPKLGGLSREKPIIVLPRLDYLAQTGSWRKYLLKKTKYQEYIYNRALIRKMEQVLVSSRYFTKLNPKQLSLFEKKARGILKLPAEKISQILHYLKNRKVTVHVHPTRFGSSGSFETFDFAHSAKKEIALHLYLRLDQPVKKLLELLASSLTRGVIDSSKFNSWRDTEAVSDFLTEYVFGVNDSSCLTINQLSKSYPRLLEKSLLYLIEINAPSGEILTFDRNTRQIYFQKKNLNKYLSVYERRFLASLIINHGTTVSFDKLADEMYHSRADIKYSLWGIRKTAQRVKDKLKIFSIPRDIILNIRGEGYMLRS